MKTSNIFKILIATTLTVACHSNQSNKVMVYGKMRNIMMQGDLSSKVQTDTLQGKNKFGLGVTEGLRGEILMLDNVIHLSEVQDSINIKTSQPDFVNAALFILADVPDWKKPSVLPIIQNINALDEWLQAAASKEGIDIEQPFPFRIKVTKGIIQGHVINWKEGAIHTHENHKQFAVSQQIDDQSELLGFFSKKHQGVFTHHSTFTHLHAITSTKDLVLHVDDLSLEEAEVSFAQ